MRKSRIFNIDLEYKRENTNVIFNYETRGYSIYEPNRVYMSHCSCGFKDNKKLHSSCPICKTALTQSTHIADHRETEFLITAYNFDKLSATIELKKYEFIYESEENTFDVKVDDVKFVFKYELNSRNKYKYKAEHILNGESEKLLKGTLENYGFGITESKVKNALVGICGISCDYWSSFSQAIWSINNKYKYCFEALQKDIYEGYEYDLGSLKTWNSLIKRLNEKEILYLIKYAQLKEGNNKTLSGYNMRSFFSNYVDNMSGLFKHIDIYESVIKETGRARNNFPRTWSNPDTLATFFYNTGFTFEELLELIEVSERQAFNIDANSYKIRNVYTELSNIGLPIDKKPREMAIYINKMSKLLDIVHSWKTYDITNDFDVKLYGKPNKMIIKKVYDKYGYKGLDHMLFNHYMNKEISPLYLYINFHDDKAIKLDCVAFLNTKYNASEITINNIKALLTAENELLTEQEEILNYINTKINENIDNKKETELAC